MTEKTIEQHFQSWEATAFGYGYGSGEPHILPALKKFFAAVGREDVPHGYDYVDLESACGSAVAWLLINRLCALGHIEYGTSPRYGWLTDTGVALRGFINSKSASELIEIICNHGSEDDMTCYPDACNCGPDGYEKGRECPNPFWRAPKASG